MITTGDISHDHEAHMLASGYNGLCIQLCITVMYTVIQSRFTVKEGAPDLLSQFWLNIQG